jgi:hypothetical protein
MWWEYRCPVVTCAGLKEQVTIRAAELVQWEQGMRRVCKHRDLTQGCQVCAGIERVIDAVGQAGAARVVPLL